MSLYVIFGVILSSFVTITIYWDFMSKMFNKRRPPQWYIRSKYSAILFLSFINLLNMPLLNLSTLLILVFSFGLLLYSDSKKRILFCNSLLLIFIATCESIGVGILNITGGTQILESNPDLYFFLTLTFSQVFVVTAYYQIILPVLRKRKINFLSDKNYLFLDIYSLFSLLTLVTLGLLMVEASNNTAIFFHILSSAGIVISNVYFIPVLEGISEKNRLEYENSMYAQQTQMQYRYYETLKNKYEISQSKVHDIKRHMNTLEKLYSEGNISEAKSYSDELRTVLDSATHHFFSDNEILNIVLNEKYQFAKENNIEFSVSFSEVNIDFINGIDLTTVFANLLDNAIEATMKVEDGRRIRISGKKFGDLILITFKNTFDGDPIIVGEKIKSSKGNRTGIGVLNVRKTIENYNGTLEISVYKNEFTCSILLPIPLKGGDERNGKHKS